MRKAKRIIVVLMAIVLFTSLAACAKKDDGKIIIGIVMPITGESSLEGEVMSSSVKMYVEDINAAGGVLGKQIDLRIYDNRGDAVETTNAARKAIQNDKVVALLGADSSTTSIAMAEVCNDLKIPQITSIATNYRVTQTEDGSARPYTFRACLSDPQISEILGKYAVEKLGYSKCAVIYNVGNDYSTGIQQEFSDAFEAAGGVITIREAFNNGDVDYRALLSKIKAFEDFDTIFLSTAAYKETALISNQARTLGITVPFVGTEAMMADDIFNIAGDAVEDSVFMSGIDVNSAGAEAFKEKYIERYGYDPTVNTAADGPLGHDALMLLVTAIENAGSTEPDKICKAIEEIRDMQGVTCKLSMIPKTHNPIREAPVYKIVDSQYVVVDKYSLEG